LKYNEKDENIKKLEKISVTS